MQRVLIPAYISDDPARPDQGLPPGSPGAPDQGLPPLSPGTPSHPIYIGGVPTHPIFLPGFPSHPIYIGGSPEHPIVVPPGSPGYPSHPISGVGDPSHPIYTPPGVPSHPIIGPGTPAHPIAPVYPISGLPDHPIVLPPDPAKPKGVPVVQMEADWEPPTTAPVPGGSWLTLDAGFGEPPAWGYVSPTHDDGGIGEPEPKGGVDVSRGHYVPISDRPDWAWVPDIGSDYGVTEADAPEPK
jgi:hypothetical protein